MPGATITLYLVNGNPKGLRTAELSNWSGKAISAPRTEISELIKRPELDSQGIYFLTGVDAQTGDRAIYIGEAEQVSKRLKQHSVKEFWHTATIFVSKDDNLTKSHIRYLEGKFIDLAKETNSSVLMNAASSGTKLPESAAADMDVFAEKCLQLLPVLGVTDFVPLAQQESKEEALLYFNPKGVSASGKRTADGFVVYAGSQAVYKARDSAKPFIVNRRQQLQQKGILKPEKDCFIFTKDVEFGSPSTAAAIIVGGSTNGLKAWRNSEDMTLKELEASETQTDTDD